MTRKNIKIDFNKRTGDYEIIHNGFSWVSDGRKPYIIIRKKIGSKYVSTLIIDLDKNTYKVVWK